MYVIALSQIPKYTSVRKGGLYSIFLSLSNTESKHFFVIWLSNLHYIYLIMFYLK